MGGNAGAFANGFTTGPEAFSTTFNNSNGVVSIVLDQRFAGFVHRTSAWSTTPAPSPVHPDLVAGAGGPAGPSVAQAQFTPGQVAGAKSLLLDDGRVHRPTAGYPNVDQNLAPASGTPKRQVKHGHVVRHHTSKRAWKHMKRAAKRHHESASA